MAFEAKTVPAYARKLPLALTTEAAELSQVLPHLALEAKHVAAQLNLGIHGRRRAGPGEEFWEFRPFTLGEPASRVDWRRSARDDTLYVREREWESASVHWLWVDMSASMNFASSLAHRPKRDRALILALALSDILVHAGERVGLLGRTAPIASRAIISRLAEALMRNTDTLSALPEDIPAKRQDHIVLIGDFIMPPAEFAAKLAKIAQRGVRGTVLLIRDPVEETFPFQGEFEFEGLEGEANWRVGDAQDIAARYRERIVNVTIELRRIALSHGFGFVKHLTNEASAQTLLALAGLLSGQARPLPEGRAQ